MDLGNLGIYVIAAALIVLAGFAVFEHRRGKKWGDFEAYLADFKTLIGNHTDAVTQATSSIATATLPPIPPPVNLNAGADKVVDAFRNSGQQSTVIGGVTGMSPPSQVVRITIPAAGHGSGGGGGSSLPPALAKQAVLGTYDNPYPARTPPFVGPGPIYTAPMPGARFAWDNPSLDMQRNLDPAFVSPGGYPIRYTIDMESGKAYGAPVLTFGDQTFQAQSADPAGIAAAESQIAQYKATVAANAAGKAEQETWSNIPGKGFTAMGPAQTGAILTNFYALMAQGYDDAAYFRMTQDERTALFNVKVSQGDPFGRTHADQDYNRVNGGDIGSAPPGFNGSPAAIARLGGAGVWNG